MNNSYFLTEFGLVMQCVWSKFPHYYTSEEIGITTLTCSFLTWGFIAIIRDVCPDMNDCENMPGPVLEILLSSRMACMN